MSGYRLSPAAQADLDGIWNYSLGQWGEEQAERYIYAIRDRLEGLASGLIPGRSAAEIRSGYSKCATGVHMIYFVTAGDGKLDVIRILHQSMDAVARLENPA